MIVTRRWLEEWLDLGDITLEKLCESLNSIGLEVERTESHKVISGVVVGKILECNKHPDADRLSVCQVDVGDSVLQIVCGAQNVETEQMVAVALLGTKINDSLTIKPVTLRGVDSSGMICSSSEIGLPNIGDGILVLDDSIGELIIGKELCQYPPLIDDLIEIELTANRGDCLSVRGVARDLCAALDKKLKKQHIAKRRDDRRGIGRVLRLESIDNIDADLEFHIVEIESIYVDFLYKLRLKLIESQAEDNLQMLVDYATHNTGVIMRLYDLEFFKQNDSDLALISLYNDQNSLATVGTKELIASTVGVSQNSSSKATSNTKCALLEASYIDPHTISSKMANSQLKSDKLYYNSSRGSEPDLSLGLENMFSLLSHSKVVLYSGNFKHNIELESHIIQVDYSYIEDTIGMKVESSKILKILRALEFDVSKSTPQQLIASAPHFRHDITSRQDIVEEIIRVVGIDNIASKPSKLTQLRCLDSYYDNYLKKRLYRTNAAQSGFFESIHFVFTDRKWLEEHGVECVDSDLELLNPMSSSLNTLRPTLVANLLNAASLNIRNNQKRVALFEIGSVFNYDREESLKMSLLLSGDLTSDSITNGAKPKQVDFANFSSACADVLGDIELQEYIPTHNLSHPYQGASVVQNGVVIGELYRVHPAIEKELGLPTTLVCEVDFNLLQFETVQTKAYSKFQPSFKDLSVVAPSTLSYKRIASVIESLENKNLQRYYVVDRYSDESMSGNISITIRFVLQSEQKTLDESDIIDLMQNITTTLKNELGVELR